MQLPRPIQTYFTARAPQDGDALAAAFAPNAIVHDEGHDHRGPQAIRAWWVAEGQISPPRTADRRDRHGRKDCRPGDRDRRFPRQPCGADLYLRSGR